MYVPHCADSGCIGSRSRLSALRHAYAGRFVLCAFILFSMARPSFGQLSSAAINGIVRDASGAVVTGAKITLRNDDTTVSRDTQSTGAGNYSFLNIPPGRYTLEVEASGFQKQKLNALTLAVNQTSSIDLNLSVSGVQQSVDVQALSATVESSTAELGTVIAQKQVVDLPLNGRNFTQLLSLTPGAVPVSVGQNSGGGNTATTLGSSFSFPAINGQTNRSNFYLVDGLNNQNTWYNTYAVAPIVDAIQEFKVNSHNDQAQFGAVTGGVINVVTKSGTNELHGSGWEYVRNDFFDARNTFQPVVTPFKQNQFGGALGGPIVIPKIYNGRSKTFFFVSAEGFRYSRPTNSFYRVPTEAEYNGDFSRSGSGQIYDPFTTRQDPANPNRFLRTPFANNQIPVSRLDQRAIAFARAVLPQAVVLPGNPANNAVITSPTRQQQENYSGRIDHNFGSKDFLWFRYGGQQLTTTNPQSIESLRASQDLPAQQFGASWVHVFTPTLTLQTQFGRSHVEFNQEYAFTPQNLIQTYGISPTVSDDFVGGISLMPSISVANYWSGGELSNPTPNLSSIYQYKSDVSKIVGRHEMRFGGSWEQVNFAQFQRNATMNFQAQQTGNPANTAEPGNSLASYLLSLPLNISRRNVNITERPGGIMGFYFQDSWKATDRLTINVGLRYDRTFIPAYGTEATIGQQGSIETGNFDFSNGTYVLQRQPPSCAERGRAPCIPGGVLPANVVVSPNGKLIRDTKTNFGPRFGIAYRVSNKTAVRAGFGIMYDNWAAAIQLPQNYQGSWPDVGTQERQNLNTPSATQLLPYASGQNPFGTTAGLLPAATPFTQVNYFVDPYIKNPYSMQWNFGLQHQFGNDTVVSANYVGSGSRRLDIGGYYNTALTPGPGDSRLRSPYPYIVATRYDRSPATGSYHSFQLSVNRRLNSGFAYQLAYTFSKSMDAGASGWFGVEGFSLQNPYDLKGSRSVSSYDIPHQVTVNLNYELPIGKGKRFSTGNKVVDYIVGNWQANTIFLARTGQPYTLTVNGDIANTGNVNYMRPDLVGDPNALGDGRTTTRWFNTQAFAIPANYTYGNVGRNTMRRMNYWNLDVSAFRQFPIKDRVRFELRGEAFNVLNTVIYGQPGANLSDPRSFGVVSGLSNTPRALQLGAKLIF